MTDIHDGLTAAGSRAIVVPSSSVVIAGIGSAGVHKNRVLPAATTADPALGVNRITWPTGRGPRSIELTAFGVANDILRLVYDAPSSAVAAKWLSATAGTDNDLPYDECRHGATIVRTFPYPLSSIMVKVIGVGPMRVFVAAT